MKIPIHRFWPKATWRSEIDELSFEERGLQRAKEGRKETIESFERPAGRLSFCLPS